MRIYTKDEWSSLTNAEKRTHIVNFADTVCWSMSFDVQNTQPDDVNYDGDYADKLHTFTNLMRIRAYFESAAWSN